MHCNEGGCRLTVALFNGDSTMKRITHTMLIVPTVIVAMAFGMASCAGNQTAMTSAKVTLSAYETVQQGMIIYGSLETCPKSKPICKDHELWQKIKAAELVATTAIVEATPVLNGTEADLGQALKAYEAIEKVREAFVEANVRLAKAKADAEAAAKLKGPVTP
jgi:hypothetical protein